MSERVNDKIIEIEKYLEELYQIVPSDFEMYKDDFKIKAACERYFEKIIESVIDLGFILVKEKNFKIPEDEESIFEVLFKEKIISEELSRKLKDAKGMRNFIIHQYEKINDELVFEVLAENLEKDIKDFVGFVGRLEWKK